jgi:hypothetical protein
VTQETWLIDEIQVRVSGFFTTHHHLHTEMGGLGKFTFPAFSQNATYRTSDGRELLMQKTHWLGSGHELLEAETVRGTADRSSLFDRALELQLDGRQYRLEPTGWLSRDWRLVDQGGQELLEIQLLGLLSRDARILVTGIIVEPDLIAFAYYLFYMRYQEEAAAGAAAAS